MKITVGLGAVDDYEDYVKAGADEMFIGCIPEEWTLKYGQMMPLNRREVRYYNVQIGSESELLILRKMMNDYKVPVSIALNALYYRPEQYQIIENYILKWVELGFDKFIIADPALVIFLWEKGVTNYIDIFASGEMSEINEYSAKWLKNIGVKRIIFNRKTPISGMKKIINSVNKISYEAFVLNENCHFQGAFCNSVHCDEFVNICNLPYKTEGFYYSLKKYKDNNSVGQSGCGLCALWDLKDAGVEYLKVVSRGNYSECTIKDIKTLKFSIEKLKKYDKNAYETIIKTEISKNCIKSCYYF